MTGPRRRDAGMTLVELSVSMFITGVLMAGIGTVMISTFRAVSTANVKTADAADLRIGLEAMSRTLRVAVQPAGEPSAFVTAASGSVAFYALLNRTGSAAVTQPLPTRVSYTWNPTTRCLEQTLTPARSLGAPTATGAIYAWDTGAVTTCLLRTAVAPEFSYYTDAVTATTLPPPVTGDELVTVLSVRALLTSQDPRDPRDTGVPAAVRISLSNVAAAN